jgi:hypothetical protein
MRDHNFEFGEMTEADIVEKKKVFEEHQRNKAAAQAQPTIAEQKTENADTAKPAVKPVFKPKIKPPTPPAAST